MYANAQIHVSVMNYVSHTENLMRFYRILISPGYLQLMPGAHTYHLQIQYHLKLHIKVQAKVKNDWLLECWVFQNNKQGFGSHIMNSLVKTCKL